MIKPEQIPDEVVEAAARAAWKLKDQRLWEILKATQPNWRDEAREALAAAINAWPGFEYRADVAFPAFGYGPNGIVLPLLNEESE